MNLKRYTVIPKKPAPLSDETLKDLVDIPKTGELIAYGHTQVNFPLYHSDPSLFIPEHLKAVTIAEAKISMKKYVLAWQEEGEPAPLSLGDELNQLDASSRAMLLVNFMQEYEDRLIMPELANKALLNSLNYPVPLMELENFRLSMIGYLAHYAGEDLEETYGKVISYGVDLNILSIEPIINAIESAGNSFPKQKKATETILLLQGGGEQRQLVAELGLALQHVGLDDVKISALAHRAESKEMQNKVRNEPPHAPMNNSQQRCAF